MPKRVALDTGIFRELCHTESEPEWSSTFVKMAKEGWSFHLTAVCFAEIIAARERSSITDAEGKKAVVILEQILSEYFPRLPINRKLFHLCGFRDKGDPIYDFDEDFEREYSIASSYQAQWVFLPEELAEKWEQHALIEPTWPTGDNE